MAKINKTIKRSRKNSVVHLKSLKEKFKKNIPFEKNMGNVFVLLLLWFAFCTVMITFPNYSWLFPKNPNSIPFHQSWPVALLLLGLMAIYVRVFVGSNHKPKKDGISSFWALTGLVVVLILSAILCLYQMDKPIGQYTADCAFFIQILRRLKDLGNYGSGFVFDYGLLPLWPYTGSLLWHLLPFASGLEIQRLTGAFFDWGIIIFIYLAGKEIAGRRVGLLAAALAAVCKPLLFKVVSGYPSNVLAFGVTIVIWLTIRLERKNTILDYVIWGASVGFLAYTTAPFEPFVPFFIFIGLGLTWWNNRKVMKFKGVPILVWISLAVFLIYFLCCNNAFPNSIPIIRQIKSFHWWILVVVAASVFLLFNQKNLKNRKDLWAKWFLGSWLAAVLSFTEISNDYMVGRIQDHALMPGMGFLSPDYLYSCFQRLSGNLQWLFWSGNDKLDMGIPTDAFFGYPEAIFIGLGMVFCLAQPNIKRIFLILTAVIGILPLLMVTGVHSGFLVGCISPCLLIGAIGLGNLLEIIPAGLSKIRFSYFLIGLLLVLFFGWAAQGVFSRVYPQWAENRLGVTDQAARDVAAGDRVYLRLDGPPIYYEGPPFYFYHDSNAIELSSTEKVPNVVIYMEMTNGELKNKISNSFPDGKWSELCFPKDPNHPVVFCCEISAGDILKKNQNVFRVSRIKEPFWKRDYLAGQCYLNLNLINWEDKVANISKPLPSSANVILDGQTIKLEGLIHMRHAGQYEITCKTGNRSLIWIDHKEIFNLIFPKIGNYAAPPVERKVLLNLKEGEHEVEVVSCFEGFCGPPDISVRYVESASPSQSLWKSFFF